MDFKIPPADIFVPKSEETFFHMRVRHGLIEEATILNHRKEVLTTFDEYHGQKLHEMKDWNAVYNHVDQHLPELEMLTGGHERGFTHIIGSDD